MDSIETRGHTRRFTVTAVLAALGVVVAYTAASASPAVVAGFAVDGAIQVLGSNDDWAEGPGSGDGLLEPGTTRNADGSCTSASANPLLFCDPVKSDPTTFPGGSKESDPSGWPPIQASQVTPKTDITNVYAYGTTTSDTPAHPVIINGMERLPKAGDLHLDFEYNKVMTGSGINQIPDRQEGDVLVAYDLGGGRNSNTGAISVKVFVADTNGEYDYDNPDFSASGSDEVNQGGVSAIINTSQIDAGPWQSYDEHYNLVNTLPAFSFMEAGIDLNVAVGLADACFNFLTVKSRASASVTSQLKDTTGPLSFPFCGGLKVQKYIDVNLSGTNNTGDTTTGTPVSGWAFEVKNSSNTTICKGLTDATGFLVCGTGTGGVGDTDTLSSLSPDTYTVIETQKTGFFNTDVGTTPDPDIKETATVSTTVTIAVGDDKTVVFGNTCYIDKTFRINSVPTDGTAPSSIKVEYQRSTDGGTTYGSVQTVSLAAQSGDASKWETTVNDLFRQTDWIKWSWYINDVTANKVVGSAGEQIGGSYPTCTDLNQDDFPSATVSGFKYKDINVSGDYESTTDQPLRGIQFTLYLDANGDGLKQTTETTVIAGPVTSAADGTYNFGTLNIPPGKYTVVETVPTAMGSWVQTEPASNGVRAVTVGLGDTAVTVGDFGNTPLSQIKVEFLPQAKLFDGTTNATKATSISCVDASSAAVGAGATNTNTYTTPNVYLNQSSIVCTVTFVDP